VLDAERFPNKHRCSCAIHVPWTCRYRTIREKNTLILLTFAEMTASSDFKPIQPLEKPAKSLT
jgi:hypothetical protein